MRTILYFNLLLLLVIMVNCTTNNPEKTNVKTEASEKDSIVQNDDFKYVIDKFADVQIIRYKIPGFEELNLKQKKLIYYLSQAALYGRDITFDQNYKHNLTIRRTLEAIWEHYNGDRTTDDFKKFEIYLKRVWFSNGIHHHASTEKFVPDCSPEYFLELIKNSVDADFHLNKGEDLTAFFNKIKPLIFDPQFDSKRVFQEEGKDLIVNSANNFYEGVNQKEVENFYDAMAYPDHERPWSIGINSKVVKEKNKIVEKIWKVGGMYSLAIEKIVYWLEQAKTVAETDLQAKAIDKLIGFYNSGSLQEWDDYNVLWVTDLDATVDFVNGFIENYGDPLSRKATWESVVNFKDMQASKRAQIISENAQWFEDHSPVNPKFRKKEVKGVSAKVITVAQLGGDCYPSTPIGINLPNADWIRKDYGSKSVTMENITYAYDKAAAGSGFMEEFCSSLEIIEREKIYGSIADNLHTDLHECLGHGSGQLLNGIRVEMLKSYQSVLEETRADLFALYYMLDSQMVKLGLMPNLDVAKAAYDSYINNGIMWQLKRVKLGATIEQAHMRNRQLIASWCFEKGMADSVIIRETNNGKTFHSITDYEKLRKLFGELLGEVQRIKSEGDYEAGKVLVETYAVKVDQVLHAEMLNRYEKLNLAPYGGFINPVFKPVFEGDSISNIDVEYPDNYPAQMIQYSKDYSPLPDYN